MLSCCAIAFDASNIRGLGGVTHLRQVLCAVEPSAYDFDQVYVWGGTVTLRAFENRPFSNL